MTPKELGAKLHNWHNGTDAIYAAGSTLFAGRDPDPATTQAAINLLTMDLVQARAGRHGWGPSEARELSALIKALTPYTKKTQRPSSASLTGVSEMLGAYIKAALWSSTDDEDRSMDLNYGPSDLTADAKRKMAADVKKFLAENSDDIGSDYKQAGHDFWLTRNGHGTGFWDGDWPKDAAKRLTAASKKFGEQYLYISRKKVHVG